MTRGNYHISGVAGVGMSALAELLLALGHDVSGSDRSFDQGHRLDVLEKLRRMGLKLLPQDGSAITPATGALLVSTAIEETNPEIVAARKHGTEIVHRADMLARLAAGKRVIAIAGTAGKTTTTALTGWLLEQCGLDPTVVNGGVVLNWAAPDRVGNCRVGKSDLFVLEVDESDRSLLKFHPELAAITNVSKDHFELAEVVALFTQFARQTAGTVLCGQGVAEQLGREVAGQADGAAAPPLVLSGTRPRAERADLHRFAYAGMEFPVPLIGRHNAENALMAVRVCATLGCPLGTLCDALPEFRGVGRRLEIVGRTAGGATVIDDYAHNPAKMAAAWRAAAETSRRVLGFWRPHGFGPLALMKDEIAAALAAAMRPDDRFHVLPVYYAGGTASRTITSEEWVGQLRARGMAAAFVADYAALEAALAPAVRGDAILGMGARDPELPAFARRLATVAPDADES